MLNGYRNDECGDSAVSEFSLYLDPGANAPANGAIHVFRPGHLLTGRVRLCLPRPLRLRNLDLMVRGSGTVGWGLGGGHYVRDDEVYMNDMAELVVTGLNEFVTLPAGEHEFPFACRLPSHLPSTFTGSFGSVAYSAKALLQAADDGAGGPWSAATAFAIETQLELSSHSELLRPCIVDARLAVGGGSSSGRSVRASLSLSKRVFAPGEDISVDATVDNRSRKTISQLSVGLVMECLYQAGGQQQHRESLLVADRTDEYRIGRMEGRRWQGVRLRIPRPIPPSGLPHCRLISVAYALLFRAEVEQCAKDLNLRVPLMVGVSLPDAESAEPATDTEVFRRLTRSSSSDLKPLGSTEKQRLESEYRIFDPAADADAEYLDDRSPAFHAADNLY